MAGWGLVGSATANAPLNTLEDIIAAQALKDEAMRKAAIEQRKLGQDDARIGIDAQRAGYEGQRVGLDMEKFGAERTDKTKDQQDFDNLIAEAQKSQPWLVPVLKARRIANVSVTPQDAAMSPEAQHTQQLEDEAAKAAAAAAAQEKARTEAAAATEQRDSRLHGFRMQEAGVRGAASEPLVQVQGPDGQPVYVPRSQAAGQKAPTRAQQANGVQRQTLDYFTRMLQAEEDARAVEDKVGPMDILTLEHSPSKTLSNFLMSDAGQKYAQAMNAWTLAKLRRESGAAISAGEFEKERQAFFKQPNDKTLDQKRADRLTNLRGMASAAGPAFQEHYGDQTLDEVLSKFTTSQAPPANPKVGDVWNSPTGPTKWDGKMWKHGG